MFKKLCLTIALCNTTLCAAVTPALQHAENLPAHEVYSKPIPATANALKPRNIILMIGDGMGAEQVSAAWIANKGKLNILRMPVTGFSCTLSASHLITDSAAGGTALACGRRTNNHWLGLTPQGESLTSLADTARRSGKSTGLVVTKDITDATPAAFYTHVDDRKKAAEIAADLVRTPFSVVVGGGAEHFTAEQVEQMKSAGTRLCLAAPKHCPYAEERGDFLCNKTADALAVLEKNEKGFFLMIEGSEIDMAAHENKLRELIAETLDFDKCVGVVLEWMERHPDTLLVITADHQTGGLVISGGNVAEGKVDATFSTNAHNGILVPVYAAGCNACNFSGVQDNTVVSDKIRSQME